MTGATTLIDGAGVVAEIAQFGAAGLIAMLWLAERRGAQERETRLTEAHGRLMEQREQLGALLDVVSENTRAMTALEGTQRRLATLVADGEDEMAA